MAALFYRGEVMKHYIIPVFIPHYGCSHQCVFCNQNKITGVITPATPDQVIAIIREHMSRIDRARHIEVAFYGGSFTALPVDVQSSLLAPAAEALRQGSIHAIRLSTRPDCLDDNIVDNLIAHGVSTVELGVQSLDNNVLGLAARGHVSEHVELAVNLLKNAQLKCGIQLMPGLPGENWSSLIKTANGVVKLMPDFVRIYPTLVIANTPLAELYKRGQYEPLSLAEAIQRSVFLKNIFSYNNINVIRVGLQATTELDDNEVVLAGPYHPAFGEMVESYRFRKMIEDVLEAINPSGQILLHYYERDHSKVRGISNSNLHYIYERYPNCKLELKGDGRAQGELVLTYCHKDYVINQSMLLNT